MTHLSHEWASGNVFIRASGHLPKGKVIDGHAHNFDHTSIVLSGSVRIKTDEQEQTFHAPSHLLIKAGVRHEITILEDETVFWCVYAHRTPQGDIVQEYTGWDKAHQ